MEFWKSKRSVNELTEVTLVVTALAVIIVPFAFLLDREGASVIVLLLAIIIGAVAFVLSWVNLGLSKTHKQRFRRLLLALLIPTAGVGAFNLSEISLNNSTSILAHYAQETEVKAISTANIHIEQDPELISILRSIGAKNDYTSLELGYHNGDMSSVCESSDALACYKQDNQGNRAIIVSKQPSAYPLKSVLAHEYLHFGWHTNKLDDDTILTSYLIDFYAKNIDLQGKIPSHYLSTGGLHAGEIFSHACTEMSEPRLGGYLASKCNEFIDISKL